MDSLTQIILGAACAEATLGKKIGNKALLFGAIGGTIPDLDVFIGRWLYSNEIDIMAFHRGFTHSIVFAILAAFILGITTHKLYNTGKRTGATTTKNWIWLFFLSIATHPILDSFTSYGTQLFLPFSDYRVAFNNISVVDPLYTIPFLMCLIALMFCNRKNLKRILWLKLGFAISSAYMLFTIGNKLYINYIFKESLIANEINYYRYSTQPSLFNNILWYGIAQTKNEYYIGFYSLFDSDNRFTDWQKIKKNHELIPKTNKDLAKLAWFSNDYYNIVKLADETFLYTDLRYRLIASKNQNSTIFVYKLFKDGDRLNARPFKINVNKYHNIKKYLYQLWQRIKGK